MLMRLAIRKDAPAAEAERLMKYLDAAIAADAAGNATGLDARLAKYVLLGRSRQAAAAGRATRRLVEGRRSPAALAADAGLRQGRAGRAREAAVALAEPLAADDALDASRLPRAGRLVSGPETRRAVSRSRRSPPGSRWTSGGCGNVLRAHLAPWENTNGPSPGTIDPQVVSGARGPVREVEQSAAARLSGAELLREIARLPPAGGAWPMRWSANRPAASIAS